MDKGQLEKWKTEMESELAGVEKQLSDLEKKRASLRAALAAFRTLLSPAEQTEIPVNHEVRDPVGEFISHLRGNGWSVEKRDGHTRLYTAKRGGLNMDLWIKFSKRSEVSGLYWFGVNPDHLVRRNGGVVLLLGTHQQYVCLPFDALHKMLEGSKNTITGQKFQIRQNNRQVELLPAGTGGEWRDVSSYYDGEGLKAIGVD